MIPRTFKLVNKSWLVRIVTTKQLQNHLDSHWGDDPDPINAADLYGLCDPGASRIFLNKDRHSSQAELEHTFYHELVHCLLFANGDTDHDEAWVDRLGGFIHQIVNTKEGVHDRIKTRSTEGPITATRGDKDEALRRQRGNPNHRRRS